MSTKSLRCLLGGVLIAGSLASPAMAGETFIDFVTDAGLLTEQFGPGTLTGAESNATENKGVFDDQATAYLFSGTRVIVTGDVTLKIRLNVLSDTGSGANNNSADLCMFIQSNTMPFEICTACFDGVDHSSFGILTPEIGSSINLGINLPAVTDTYTLFYDISQDKATLSRDNTPISVSVFGALNAALSYNVGLYSTGGPIQLRNFTAIGAGIPDFSGGGGDPLDPDNPWVNFGITRGTGAEGDPFSTLTEALAAANPAGATIHIVPGTDSIETFTGGNEISQNVTLVNSDPGFSSVSIGVPARRDVDLSTEGFVSRGALRKK